MRIDREPEEPAAGTGLVVAQHAFDRYAGLPLVEHHGLVVRDTVLVQHVGVDANRMGAPARIGACVKQVG